MSAFEERTKRQIYYDLRAVLTSAVEEFRRESSRIRSAEMEGLENSLVNIIKDEEDRLAKLWDLQAELVAIEGME